MPYAVEAELHEAVILDSATAEGEQIRCIVPSFDEHLATDLASWSPISNSLGVYYPKAGDRAIVSYHPDGPATIVWWEPASEVPDHGAGEDGSDLTYVHNQPTASTTWTFTHGLGKVPSIQCYDMTGEEIEGQITEATTTTATIAFSAAVAGKAVCN